MQSETVYMVSEALSQALETMAFMDVEPCEDRPMHPGVIITAEINFSGPACGTLRASAGIDFAQMLAENVSGLDEITEEQCIDAMQELVNVTCGLILPMLASDQSDVFDLTVPHLTRSEERLHWEDFLDLDDVSVVNVEGFPVATRLIIN